MQELINAIEAVVPGISAAVPSSEPNSGFETEQRLATQIGELWSIHTQAQAAAAQSKEHLSQIRHQLGERLCEVKKLVARPGRGGGWSAFLAAQGIPRASADRYVQRYEKTLHPDSNCVNESIESTELAVRKLFAAVWPRLRRVITSKEALDLFIRELKVAYDGRAVHQCESGIASATAPQPTLEPVGARPERVPELSTPTWESGVGPGPFYDEAR
jgi:excinuclease UvrABC nuclease subunit